MMWIADHGETATMGEKLTRGLASTLMWGKVEAGIVFAASGPQVLPSQLLMFM